MRGFTDAYGNADGDAHSYGHANSDSYSYSDTDTYAKGHAIAAAASNNTTAASLVGSSCNRFRRELAKSTASSRRSLGIVAKAGTDGTLCVVLLDAGRLWYEQAIRSPLQIADSRQPVRSGGIHSPHMRDSCLGLSLGRATASRARHSAQADDSLSLSPLPEHPPRP